MSIVLLEDWTEQPPYLTGANWVNPMASKMTILWSAATQCNQSPGGEFSVNSSTANIKITAGRQASLSFNGSQGLDSYTIGASAFGLNGASKLSAMAVFSIDNLAAERAVFGRWGNIGSRHFYIGVNSSGSVVFAVASSTVVRVGSSATGTIGVGNDYVVCLRWDGSSDTMTCLVNGVLKGLTLGGSAVSSLPSVAAPVVIGQQSYTSAPMIGSVSMVAATPVALSDAEIASLSTNPWQLFAP